MPSASNISDPRSPGGPRRHGGARGPRLVAALAFVLASSPAHGQVLNVRNYMHADGLPQIQITALHQDTRGFIWLGTYGGLARYDGRSFTTLTVADGLASNRVSDLSESPPGRLVVGTVGGGLCFVVDRAVTCLRRSDGLGHDVVEDVHVSSSGDVWAATEGGLTLVRDRHAVRTYTTADGLPSDDVRLVTTSADGRLWVVTPEGTATLEGDRFQVRAGPWGPGSPTLLRPVAAGLLAATESGIFLAARDGITRIPGGGIPPGTPVTDAHDDGEGGFWLATRAGALHFDGTATTRLTTANGLVVDDLNRVLVDRERSVWFGADGGLSKLVPGPFLLLNRGLPNRVVRAVAEDPSGRIWVGTRDGPAVLEGDVFRPLPLPRAVTDPRVYALGVGPDGDMWVGTRDGLVRYGRGGTVRLLHVSDGLPDPYVTSLQPDGSGLWVATAAGLARWEAGRLHAVDRPELAGAFVVSTALDEHGRLWVGRRLGGISIYDGASVTALGPREGLTDQTIWSLARDPRGGMWAGTNGAGAYRIGDEGVTRYTTADGLVDDFVWQVLPDRRGSVWMFTSHGLDRLTDGAITHFGPQQGLFDPEGTASAALEDSQGHLWFGSGTGLYRYQPQFQGPRVPPPPIYIDGLSAGRRDFPLQGARIPAGSGVLTVRFASPSFRDETSIRFRHRIPSVSRAWSDPVPENVVGFALRPGRHTLEVVAVDGDGRQSASPATVVFTVLPHFWQAWWFRLVMALLVAGGATGLFHLRTRWLASERQRLESLVGVRTRELEAKTDRLEAEAAERERLTAQLNQAQKMEAVGRLAGGIAHDFNNLLTVVMGHAQLVAADEHVPDPLRTDVDAIQSAAERGAALVAQLLTFSRRQMVTSARIDLNESVRRSTELLGRLIGDDVTLTVEPAPRPAMIDADETLLGQVLDNLAVNAADAMEPGGRVTLAIGHRTIEEPLTGPGPDRIPPGGYVTLTVTDNGHGMSPETRERVFEPFFTTREVGRGTGLGMSTVYGVVHQCGGFIQLASELGRGTEVRIFLPDATAEPPGERPRWMGAVREG